MIVKLAETYYYIDDKFIKNIINQTQHRAQSIPA